LRNLQQELALTGLVFPSVMFANLEQKEHFFPLIDARKHVHFN
jgi:hypothetical protein